MNRRFALAMVTVPFLVGTAGAEQEDKPSSSTISPGDAAAIAIVLQDVLADAESPLEHFGDDPKVLRFSLEPINFGIRAKEIIERVNGKGENSLSNDQLELAREAVAEMESRTKEKSAFTGFLPRDKRIVLYTKEQMEENTRERLRGKFRPQVFEAYRPGYSRDHSMALVNLSFTWGPHGGEAVFVLVRRGEGWMILTRKYVYYA